jgi:hypothetical protein
MMPVFFRYIVVALFLFTPAIAWAADEIGSVAAVKGSAKATGAGGNRALKAGSALFEGDTVIASSGGNVQIKLDDGTRLVVGAASQLELKAYLRRNAGTASKVTVKALRGTFRFITGKSKKSAYEIQTTNSVIGIRGTGFDIKVRDRTLAAVLQGSILITGANGQEVVASAGCEVAEAGRGSVRAKLFDDEPKSNRLKQDFPFIINQNSLRREFRLPVDNCRSSLRANADDGTGDNNASPQRPRNNNQRGNNVQ